MATEYVVGFLFSDDRKKVALIRKQRPEWQRGKLNGIGGHIDEYESRDQAMVREFKEETGRYITAKWTPYCTIKNADFVVYFFKAFSTVDLALLDSPTDEEIVIYEVDALPDNVIPNLRWLIPMALDNELRFSITTYWELPGDG